MCEKADLRAQMRQLRAAWSPAYIAASDLMIEERLLGLPAWRAAQTVFSYVSVGAEPSTRGLLSAALKAGKRLCVPKCQKRGIMRAREIRALAELKPAPFGLLEPGEDAPLVAPADIDLVIVPCLAADAQGHRLGHGGGYYDRYLRLIRCPSICLCRGQALLPAVPAEAHDVRVQMVLTEDGLLRILP
jgi:5-formyltetrahydrofolate cyclo-ligase